MNAIITAIVIRILSGVVEWLGSYIGQLIERYQRYKAFEGEAAKDLLDLAAKREVLNNATGEDLEKAKADFAAAASRFGRLRV